LTVFLNDFSYVDERLNFEEAPQNETPVSIEAVKDSEAEISEEFDSVVLTPILTSFLIG